MYAQIYAEAESRANLFAMPKHNSINDRQAKCGGTAYPPACSMRLMFLKFDRDILKDAKIP